MDKNFLGNITDKSRIYILYKMNGGVFMVYDEKNITKMQNIILENRNNLNVSGVLDVLNFDEQMITLDTELGILIIKGDDLRLNKFNLENTELSVEGEITSLVYNDKSNAGKKNEGVLTKIFK